MLCASPALAQPLPRVISINLCTDQLLVRFADPAQILGLSPNARDGARSALAAEMARFPILSGTAEEIVALKPDLVLAGRFTKRATREMVERQGYRLATFDAVRSLDDAKAQMREVGALVGHPGRAEAEVAALDAAIARARRAAAVRPLSVLPLQRRGWVSGRDTLMTSLLETVGLVNAGASLSRGGRQVTLEAIVGSRPDLLLVSARPGLAEDQGSAFLEHPALARLYPPHKRISLAERSTVCGGPMLSAALERLAEEVEALR